MHGLSNAELNEGLGEPEIGIINRTDRRPLGPGMPQYIVRPSVVSGVPLDATKIIDLGRSFHATDVPPLFHTPLFLRAPEIIFKDKVDLRMDLWSMGCMVRLRRYTYEMTHKYGRFSNLSPAGRRSTV